MTMLKNDSGDNLLENDDLIRDPEFISMQPKDIVEYFKDDLERIRIQKENEKRLWKTLLKWALIIIGIIISIVLFNYFVKPYTDELAKYMEEISDDANFKVYSFYTFIIIIMCITPFPGFWVFSIIVAIITRPLWKSVSIIFLGQIIPSIICLVLIRTCERSFFQNRYSKSIVFRIFNDECKKNPWICSFLCNMVLLPTCTSNYVLPLTDMTEVQYLVPKLIYYGIQAILLGKVGADVKNIQDFQKKDKSFFDMSLFEQINIIFSFFLFIVSIIAAIMFTIRFNKKYSRYEKSNFIQKKLEELTEKMEEQDEDHKKIEQVTVQIQDEMIEPLLID